VIELIWGYNFAPNIYTTFKSSPWLDLFDQKYSKTRATLLCWVKHMTGKVQGNCL